MEEDLTAGLRQGMPPEEAQAQFAELCRHKNPITGEKGRQVSSKRMSQMWLDQQRVQADLELSQERLLKLQVEWSVAGLDQ